MYYAIDKTPAVQLSAFDKQSNKNLKSVLNNNLSIFFNKMAFSTEYSLIFALMLSLLTFSGMQIFKPWFAVSQLNVIFGGYLGSLLFTFLLTVVGNFENLVYGKSYQMKIVPEVALCLILTFIASASIHRVCATTSILFSLVYLYFINRHSQRIYAAPTVTVTAQSGKKKK
ncbi:protein KRTCAP2 homolog [Agrilus planipennis]|uniref:Protein KRTCAP2 homolog n=1 Tax=Agrilus planipennis TaxID=224129 RepID=A0A7F5RD38_AGRPL|nr:protein KRTCAP2 homolog [Agrilus planipennis]